MDFALEALGLRNAFRDTVAVDGVDLTVRTGERLALLGANGAGKATTLLMLLGAVAPDAGTVTVLGHRLPRGRSEAMTDTRFAAGYLPLPYRLRVREVLAFFGHLHGVRHPEAAIAAGLERFRISHLAGSMATETAWAWCWTPSLAKIRCLWFSTVWVLIPVAAATVRVVAPAFIAPSTATSREVRSRRRSASGTSVLPAVASRGPGSCAAERTTLNSLATPAERVKTEQIPAR